MKKEFVSPEVEAKRAIYRARYRILAQDPEFRRMNNERVKAWYAKNRKRGCERARIWRIENRERDKINHRNWIKKNKDRKNELARRWRKLNPEYCKSYSKEWRKKNPEALVIKSSRRRSWQIGAPFIWNIPLWKRAVDAFGGRCAYCQREAKPLHQDHFIPICSPFCPGTVPWNMVPACADCNYSKSSYMPTRWMKDKTRLAFILNWLEDQKNNK